MGGTVRVRWVRYGREAAEELRSTIAIAKGGEPLAPVTIVVPSNYVGVASRRLLASGTLGPICARGEGVAAVSFVTVYRLAELLGSTGLAAQGRRPVSTPVLAAAMRGALTRDPGIFAPVAGHAATETALVAAYRELRDLSEGALDNLARKSERAADVVRLHRAARASLEGEFYDEEDLLDSAGECVRSDVGGVVGRLGPVIVYLPERLSRHGGALLGALGAAGDVVVLAGTTGDERADVEVARSVRRIEPALGGGGSSSGGKPGTASLPHVVSADRTRIITVSDCDEEVRAAVRCIVDAARDGMPLDRMAILHASPVPYARLAHEQLAAAGIALNGAAVMPLTARVVGRTLLALLALPDSGFRRQEVFAWLSGAQLRRDGRSLPVVAWERLSREAGVVAGRADWDQRLTDLAIEKDNKAERAEGDHDAPPWLAERERKSAERARGLRDFVVGLVDDLAGAEQPSRWSERAEWARRHILSLFGDERSRSLWPTAERKAAERVEQALARLALLDAIEPSVELDVFTRTLELELETDLGRVGRMGEGVLVGSVAMGAGLDLDLVVVLGLAEGLFPSPAHDDSLLPDHERAATVDELPLRSQSVERQHRQLLASLAGATHQVLCVPRGDLRRNMERVPSRWVLEIASTLAGERWWSGELFAREQSWISHVASFDAGIRHVAFPASEQEHRLRSLMVHGSTRVAVPVLAAAGDPGLAAGAELVAGRRSDAFTRFDGNLAGSAVPSPAEKLNSTTRLEKWAGCPFAYFLQNVLSVKEIENPEDEMQITAKDKGSLIHQVLEEFIQEVLSRPEAERPGPDNPWTAKDMDLIATIGDRVCAVYQRKGLTGRPIFWHQDRRRIIADLHRFLEADSRYRVEHGARPLSVELAFGFAPDGSDTVSLPLPDGRHVRFRGYADRIDMADDGTLHVLDYKTGKPDAYKDLTEENPDDRGRHLQLAVYGQAARLLYGTPDTPVRADYWFVSAGGTFERQGYEVTPAALAHVGETVQTMVNGIEAGVFPSLPTAQSTSPWTQCPYCDPDNMGVTELRRLYERKRHDPAMDLFVNLADPQEDDTVVLDGEVERSVDA
jgi:ATP-dependent helicase/nuclease subunit B